MTNENEQGFAISCPDGLWIAGLVRVGSKWRWVLGIEEERVIYPTHAAAQMYVDCMTSDVGEYEIEETV